MDCLDEATYYGLVLTAVEVGHSFASTNQARLRMSTESFASRVVGFVSHAACIIVERFGSIQARVGTAVWAKPPFVLL